MAEIKEYGLMEERSVLDHGFVRLDAHMADDLSVVNSARVSFARRKDVVELEDRGLIKFLMRERHGTPFEHNAFRIHIKCPIFVAREWQRHRIGSFNEWSARYSKLESEFYIPNAKDVRKRVGKPGQYRYEQIDPGGAGWFSAVLTHNGQNCFELYEDALNRGVAPEQARFFLPVNIYTQFYWTVNARSMMNFLSLRLPETAQWEIRQYAQDVDDIFCELMPLTWGAFAETRIAP